MRSAPDPFTLTAPLEIQQWLERMVQQQPLLRIHNPETQESFLTTLLDLDERTNQLFIDASRDEAMNRRFAGASRITLSTQLEQVPFEFTVFNLQLGQHRDMPYFYCSIPSTIRRIQRRNSFRVEVPKIPPAICRINTDSQQLELLIENISTTGVAIISLEAEPPLKPPQFLPKNILELPDFGTLITDMTLVRIQELQKQDKKAYLLGCRFENMEPQQERDLQHYIFQLQRIQSARDKGLY